MREQTTPAADRTVPADERAIPADERTGPAGERTGPADERTARAEERAIPVPDRTALVVGVTHPELLESAARGSRHCVALASSRRAAQGARAFAERRGFSCRVIKASSPEAASASDLARAGSSFDVIVLDHPAASGAALAQVLAHARRVVAPAGRVWIFEPYDSLESGRGRIVEHPLARLRRLLGAAGLVCERLSPVEADGEHVLAAVARAAAADAPQSINAAGMRP